MKPIKVLIIGDDPVAIARHEATFGNDTFQLRTAVSPGSGFAALQLFKADVVVLDLKMPIKSGLAWITAARQLPGFERLPVIVVTDALPESDEYMAALAFGVRGVISRKLWQPAAVLASVRRAAKDPGASAFNRAA